MVPQQPLELNEIQQALDNNTGFPFELEIVRRLEAYKDFYYIVQPNYSFEDHDTGQARELDFHALAALPLSKKNSEYVFINILGSCKNNKNPYVFFTRELRMAGVFFEPDVPIAGFPLEIHTGDGEIESIEWNFRLHKRFHIANTKIASSQFCELKKKNNTWGVQSEPIFNNTIIPMIKGLSREIADYNKQFSEDKDIIVPSYQISHATLVLNGPLLQYHIPIEGSPVLRHTNHVVFIRQYDSKTIKCNYAIDVIHQSYFNDYLDLIRDEATKFVNIVRRHRKAINTSIQRIASTKSESNNIITVGETNG